MYNRSIQHTCNGFYKETNLIYLPLDVSRCFLADTLQTLNASIVFCLHKNIWLHIHNNTGLFSTSAFCFDASLSKIRYFHKYYTILSYFQKKIECEKRYAKCFINCINFCIHPNTSRQIQSDDLWENCALHQWC